MNYPSKTSATHAAPLPNSRQAPPPPHSHHPGYDRQGHGRPHSQPQPPPTMHHSQISGVPQQPDFYPGATNGPYPQGPPPAEHQSGSSNSRPPSFPRPSQYNYHHVQTTPSGQHVRTCPITCEGCAHGQPWPSAPLQPPGSPQNQPSPIAHISKSGRPRHPMPPGNPPGLQPHVANERPHAQPPPQIPQGTARGLPVLPTAPLPTVPVTPITNIPITSVATEISIPASTAPPPRPPPPHPSASALPQPPPHDTDPVAELWPAFNGMQNFWHEIHTQYAELKARLNRAIQERDEARGHAISYRNQRDALQAHKESNTTASTASSGNSALDGQLAILTSGISEREEEIAHGWRRMAKARIQEATSPNLKEGEAPVKMEEDPDFRIPTLSRKLPPGSVLAALNCTQPASAAPLSQPEAPAIIDLVSPPGSPGLSHPDLRPHPSDLPPRLTLGKRRYSETITAEQPESSLDEPSTFSPSGKRPRLPSLAVSTTTTTSEPPATPTSTPIVALHSPKVALPTKSEDPASSPPAFPLQPSDKIPEPSHSQKLENLRLLRHILYPSYQGAQTHIQCKMCMTQDVTMVFQVEKTTDDELLDHCLFGHPMAAAELGMMGRDQILELVKNHERGDA
ncbi:hypothetical protein DL96DRAFT_1711489 [Flagelloscypha sp. PMI_526]|nr:hypothetical protein DL96DRAFT_1711489 [Flagelloscypha sp. PMI_526]